MALAVIKTGQKANNLYDFATMNYTLYLVNGLDRNGAYAGDVYRNMGVTAPMTLRQEFTTGAAYDHTGADKLKITLDQYANGTDDYYVGGTFVIDPDGDNVWALITDYDGTTKVATFTNTTGHLGKSYASGTEYKIEERPRLTAGSGGNCTAGAYNVCITYYDETHDIESNASTSRQVTVTDNQKITVSYLPKPRDANVTHWRIYRTLVDGATYYLETSRAIGTWAGDETVELTDSDATLSAKSSLSSSNNTFVTFPYIEAAKDRLFLGGKTIYNTGTINVENDSRTVIGVGTAWTDAYVDLEIIIGTDYYSYTIESVEDATHLTIDTAYAGPTGTNNAYSIAGNGSLIMYCEKDSATGLSLPESVVRSTNYLYVGQGDNDVITGMKSIGDDDLMVFKRYHQYRIQGSSVDDLTAPTFVADSGSAGNWCIAHLDGNIFYLMPSGGCRITSGAGLPASISAPVQSWFEPDTINEERNPYAVAQFFNRLRQMWLSVTSADETEHDLVYIYDPDMREWFKYSGLNVNAIGTIIDSNGKEQLYTGDNVGFVYEQDYGSADGVHSGTVKGVVSYTTTTTSSSSSSSSTSSSSTTTTSSTTTEGGE